ncbi:amidohydrolase family protein [Phenylobacterium sp.]|uniref:amidohydrolase n=1 Tax=Phenylobacterium sp. TaxID=1871053 RepID=UPI0025F5725F|nr:amidohydrolase family protein [Phenylobacterium sp.]
MGSARAAGADTVYRNGVVITVDDVHPRAQAVAVKDGRIVGVGSDAAVTRRWGHGARIVDLQGKVMVPGFVDGHSHIGDLVGFWRLPDLSPPPVGTTRAIADIQRVLRERIATAHPAPGEMVFGVGYDDSLLAERRHPSRAELDAVSAVQPICVAHVSGHLARCNTPALARLGLTRDTPDPKGGRLGRDANGELNGALEEQAVFLALAAAPRMDAEDARRAFGEIQTYYASLGYTTAQDGQTSSPVTLGLLLDAQRDGTLEIDVASYPKWTIIDDLVAKQGIRIGGPYERHLKFAGVKISADGSPQGKTAYLTQPYVHPPAGEKPDYRGFPTVPADELSRLYATFMGRGWQVQTHCNGDACIDMLLAAVRHAYAVNPQARATRPVVVHSQVTRPDQVKAYAELGIFPTFFAEHTYYWGDWHRTETLGPDRAAYISPTADALKAGVRFSLHTDAPVVPPDPMHAMWSAVNRVTRSGYALGPGQRISPMDALRAVTIWPAWQHFDEASRGSITPGKLADLVVLDADPLTVEPMAIRDIKVLATIKEGREIYRRGETPVARVPFAGTP